MRCVFTDGLDAFFGVTLPLFFVVSFDSFGSHVGLYKPPCNGVVEEVDQAGACLIASARR
ncbi:hypothetical protein FQZ97_1097600 [compost metagenome]